MVEPGHRSATAYGRGGLAESLAWYHHVPVNFTSTQSGGLARFSDVMESSRDKKVFVHSAANYRVSSFVALYGQAKLGWSASEADAHVRRVWEPNETWAAFIDEHRRR